MSQINLKDVRDRLRNKLVATPFDIPEEWEDGFLDFLQDIYISGVVTGFKQGGLVCEMQSTSMASWYQDRVDEREKSQIVGVE